MATPTVPPIVLESKSAKEFTEPHDPVHLRKPKVHVDVALSLTGMAACRAIRGTWK
jgi:hypothetical protein